MSDDLVAGNESGGWGAPAGIQNYCTGEMEFGGMIWYGDEFPTAADFEALIGYYGDTVNIDVPTLFGLPSHRERCLDKPCYQAPSVKP